MAAVALLAGWTTVAEAQVARAVGIVRDDTGQPIRGATVRADNPDAALSTLTVTTDDKGRFALIGLARGNWTFVAEAPGFQSQFNEMNITRTQTPNPPLIFSLQKAVVRPSAAVEGLSSKDLQRQLAAAEVLFNQQKFEEAVVIYRGILEAAPSLAVVNLQIGAAYRSIKQYDQALGAYTALLSADPGNPRATVGAAMANLEKGDEQAAERLLITAAETSTDRDVFYQLAELKSRKNQTDEAMTWYRKAANADASWGKPLFKLGSIARSRGDRQTAVDTMARVIAVDPTSPEAAQAKVVLNELKQ